MFFPGEKVEDDLMNTESSDEEEDDDDDDDESWPIESNSLNVCGYDQDIQGGYVYSCGYGYFGQLGYTTTQSTTIPRKIDSLVNIVQISCGEGHSIAVSGSGIVYSWGNNKYGQLGLGDTNDRYSPVQIKSITYKIADSSCGLVHTTLLTRDGQIYTFGCGSLARLGHGENKHVLIPKIISTLKGKKIVQVACGSSFTICLSNNGSIFTWGCNRYGQLGHGKNLPVQIIPRHVTTLFGKPVIKVACGKHHTVCLTENGECYSFGGGMCGQLGNRSKQNQFLPKLIDNFHKKKVTDITCGYLHTLALTSDGKLFIWGYFSDDHLGLSEGEEYYSSPLSIDNDHVSNQFIKLTAGGWHNAALTNKGELYTWGFGYRGRLGHGNEVDFDNEQFQNPKVPLLVGHFKNQFVLNMACGGAHTLAIVLDLEQKNAEKEESVENIQMNVQDNCT